MDLILSGDQILGSIIDSFNTTSTKQITAKLTELASKLNNSTIDYNSYVSGKNTAVNDLTAIIQNMNPAGKGHKLVQDKTREVKSQIAEADKAYSKFAKDVQAEQDALSSKLDEANEKAMKQGRGAISRVVPAAKQTAAWIDQSYDKLKEALK